MRNNYIVTVKRGQEYIEDIEPKVFEIEVSPQNREKAIDISERKLYHVMKKVSLEYKWIVDYLIHYNIIFSTKAETAEIDTYTRTIRINPFYFAVLTKNECISLILHEILHYILAIDEIRSGLNVEPGTGKHNLLNVAHDFIVNEMIVKEYKLPLPSVCVKTIKDKKGMRIIFNKYCEGELKAGLYFGREDWQKHGIIFSVEDIYQYLLKNSKMIMDLIVFDKTGKFIISHNRIPIRISDKFSTVIKSTLKQLGLSDHPYYYIMYITVKLPNGKVITTTKDGGSELGRRREEGEEGEREKGRGKQRRIKEEAGPPPPPLPPTPEEEKIKELVKIIQQGIIGWKEVLSKFLNYSIMASARGFEDYSYYPPSRRTESLRPFIGDTVLPSLVSTLDKLKAAVVVDISGSISQKLLSVFVSEVIRMLRTFVEYEILLIQCDDKVHVRDPKLVDEEKRILRSNFDDYVILRTGQKIPKGFWRVGGATCYTPAFALVDKLRFRPHVLVYLTDLEVDERCVPPEPPYPVVWVWATKGLKRPQYTPSYGEIVRLDFHDVYGWHV